MTTAAGGWEPTSALELALVEARSNADDATYLGLLARADLLVPIGAGTSWPVTTVDGRTLVLAFTSERAVGHVLGEPRRCRRVRIAELVRAWPDPQVWLAVDPGLTIQAILSSDAVEAMASYVEEPDGALEWALAAAGDDPSAYAAALVDAEVFLPLVGPVRDVTDPRFEWPLTGDDDVVPVYTSEGRLRDQLGGDQDLIGLPFVALLLAWPDPAVALEINPDSTIGARLDGEAIGGLAARLSTAPALAGSGVLVQVMVPAAHIPRFLSDRHDRVAGLIHRRPPGDPPLASRYQDLGLLGHGSPFGADDEYGFLLRWVDPDESAYRRPRSDGVTLPDGAVLVRVDRAGGETIIAHHHPAGWSP